MRAQPTDLISHVCVFAHCNDAPEARTLVAIGGACEPFNF